jgi:hypothetical protein
VFVLSVYSYHRTATAIHDIIYNLLYFSFEVFYMGRVIVYRSDDAAAGVFAGCAARCWAAMLQHRQHHPMELDEADVVQIWVVTDCNHDVDFGPEGVVKV